MSDIRFNPGELISSLQAFKADSLSFWQDSTPLAMLETQVRNAMSLPIGRRVTLEIPPKTPLKTLPSQQKYTLKLDDQNVGVHVVGHLTVTWTCVVAREGRKGPIFLVIDGLASIGCKFDCEHANKVVSLSCVHFDIQAKDGPGPTLHAQLSDRQNAAGFDIPRLLNANITFIDAMDLVLGDLFPESWPKKGSTAGSVWLAPQKTRLEALFQKYAARAATSGWQGVKRTCMHSLGAQL